MRVLLIEDEPRIQGFVRDALEAEGISVDAASTGPSGLRLALERTHDLVVLDLMLPGLSGLGVLRELREARPDRPVLILSARSDLQTKLRGFELGATDYLTKPFALDEFLARVRVQLRRQVEPDGFTLRAGAIELDLMRREARVDGRRTELSHREFSLLRCLTGRAGDVVSREQLLADAWGIDFDPGTNVVDVCVRRLRNKLGPAARIETVRNAGYCIARD